MTHKITTIFHTSTHVNAPIHLIPGGKGVGELALGRVLRHRRRPLDPEEEMGADRAGRPRKGDAGDRGRRHRPHQYRLAPPLCRQPGIFRPRAGPEQASRRMAGEEEGEAGRRRHRDASIIRSRPRSARTAMARRSSTCCRNTRRRPAARRTRISPIGTSRTRRCSRPASRPSRMSAAISMR